MYLKKKNNENLSSREKYINPCRGEINTRLLWCVGVGNRLRSSKGKVETQENWEWKGGFESLFCFGFVFCFCYSVCFVLYFIVVLCKLRGRCTSLLN